MTVRNVDNEALVRKRTIRELSAQAHELSISISHRVQAHQLFIMALTTKYVDDDILRASARGIYITSRDGDDNNNGNDGKKCRRPGPMGESMEFSYCVA
jgi:hypothetical protein